jgi:hypothetical protein
MKLQLPFVGMAREMRHLSRAFVTGDPVLLPGPNTMWAAISSFLRSASIL